MFSIFSRKRFLRDLLVDFVDIHNHILPGIDDGAKTIEEALLLIDNMKQLGIKEFIPTPHVMQDFYPNTDETIGEAYQNVLSAIHTYKDYTGISVNPAAEYMLDVHFETFLETHNLFTLKSNYVLVELSYYQPPLNLEAIIFKIKTKGYIPVLAHPERYIYFHQNFDYYKKLKQMGCMLQLNFLSLSTYYGTSVNKAAFKLIKNKWIDFVGTDIHNTRQVSKLESITLNKSVQDSLTPIIKATNHTFSVR
ncbi:histidinol phosphatase [Tamlana fucoidanivorans]|uniref:protein-tyrosine-phosphatase n=1 Tax=Allotamlana fucoidanivorans TaxID=2583814 RepID=A0A5C4SQA7_9FLAO|nr:CpsB/CapC family capsule biosynthesis tyrosine phosphatase [Tamlana fucoidanivorans]TNJ46452.1 histidinol phosphatase [Tamlana fucoidanivorans]